MEFLKSILGDELFGQVTAAVNAYNEKPENKDKQVKLANLSEGRYVDKEKYNGAVAEKKNLEGQINTLNGTIKTLKENNSDNEELQKTITTLQTELKNQQIANVNTTKTYALREQLSKAGVLDPDYLIYKAGDIERFTFDKENHPVGVEEAVRAYKEDTVLVHLFKQKPKKPLYNSQNGGLDGNVNPFAKETYNLAKQGELLKSNPEQTRAMAAAAEVSI